MTISFLLTAFLFLRDAVALPQDWPCDYIEVFKTDVIRDNKKDFEYHYQGETDKYFLSINLMGSHPFPNSFANCGNDGCWGKITEKATQKTENLRFFCEEFDEDYSKAKCAVSFGDEAVFDEEMKGHYVVHYCSDNPDKTLQFNLSDCEKCHCTMDWYEGQDKTEIGQWNMACNKEQNGMHCFSFDGYLEWMDYQKEFDDFKNCVGLSL